MGHSASAADMIRTFVVSIVFFTVVGLLAPASCRCATTLRQFE
jgi:hypothetical protein